MGQKHTEGKGDRKKRKRAGVGDTEVHVHLKKKLLDMTKIRLKANIK